MICRLDYNIKFDLLSTLEQFYLMHTIHKVHTKLQYFDIKLTINEVFWLDWKGKKEGEKNANDHNNNNNWIVNIEIDFSFFLFSLVLDRIKNGLILLTHTRKIKFYSCSQANKTQFTWIFFFLENILQQSLFIGRFWYYSYCYWILLSLFSSSAIGFNSEQKQHCFWCNMKI